MIRILQCVGQMGSGGIENFLMNVYRKIDRTQIQFDFMVEKRCNDGEGFDSEIESLGGKIYVIPSRKAGLLKSRRALDQFFAKHTEYSTVHCHVSSLSNVMILKAAERAGISQRIVHSHSTTEGGNRVHVILHKLHQLQLESFATDIFACSDKAARWLVGEKRYQKGQYRFIPNGIDPQKYFYSENLRKEIRNEFHIAEDCTVIGLIGRLVWQKNHKFLIRLFSEYHNRICSNSKLVIVGDGALRAEIEKAIHDAQMDEYVIMTGSRADAFKFYSALDCFVMPSINEGLPVSLVEAQACSLPCVVSENITKNVAISEMIHYCSLDAPVDDWINTIQSSVNHQRIVEDKLFCDNPFNIDMVVQQLSDFYLKN